MAMKNRQYPRVIYHAWRLLNITDNVVADMSKLEKIRDKQFDKFYGKNLTPTQKKNLHEGLVGQASTPAPTKLLTASTPDPELITQAGIMQWLKEVLPTQRELQGEVLDRIFKNKISKQREGARDVLREAEGIYKGMTGLFSRLDDARTDFNKYMETVSSWKEDYNEFKTTLTALYREHFDELIPEEVKAADPVQAPIEEPAPQAETAGESTPESETVEVTDEELMEDSTPQPQTEAVPTVPETTHPESVMEDPHTPDDAAYGEEAPDIPMEQEDTGNIADYVVAEKYTLSLIRKAEKALEEGDKGVAVALLAKASEVADDHGAEKVSASLLEEALRISQE